MTRTRNPENASLPERWRYRCGTFSYMVPIGEEHHFEGKKEFALGRSREEADKTWQSIMSSAEPVAASQDASASSVFYLYRFFSKGGMLLYIGQTKGLGNRLAQHESSTNWFGQVASIRVEKYATRIDSLRAESNAIRSESPLHNCHESFN